LPEAPRIWLMELAVSIHLNILLLLSVSTPKTITTKGLKSQVLINPFCATDIHTHSLTFV
jgi:hypothetical protein